jgi:hypothetical protein
MWRSLNNFWYTLRKVLHMHWIIIGTNNTPPISLLEGDGIPLALLYCADATFASWACCRINTQQLANVVSTTLATNTSLAVPWTLQQTTQYNKYYIWNLKLLIQIKLSMTLLETYQPWIISESWYCVRRPISWC